MSEVSLLIGTRRGLFIARSRQDRSRWSVSEPKLVGREIYHAVADPRRPGLKWAASRHRIWGAHVHRSDDGGESWTTLPGAPAHADERGLRTIWYLRPGAGADPDTLWAGVEPAGLFVSHDAGMSWQGVRALNDHPTREVWQPMGGGLALSDVALDPNDPRRMWAAVSAGGVYRSEDAGQSWKPCNSGVRACFQPDVHPAAGQCVHKVIVHPRTPSRLWQQNHCGTYRSDDGGDSWVEVTANGLPTDYGYALAIDPHDPDAAWVVPEESSHMRTVAGGRLRVFRTRDAGRSWQPLTCGLPRERAWVTVLREALTSDELQPLGLYLGTSGGQLFASRDGGDRWHRIAGYLPRILSVAATTT